MQTQFKTHEKYLDLIEALACEERSYRQHALKDSEYSTIISTLSRPEQKDFVLAMARWIADEHWRNGQQIYQGYGNLTQTQREHNNRLFRRKSNVQNTMLQLLRRKLPFSHDEVLTLLSWAVEQQPYDCAAPQMARLLENYLKENPLTTAIQEQIEQLIKTIDTGFFLYTSKRRRWQARFKEIGELRESKFPINPGEAWGDAIIADIATMEAATQARWIELIELCATARSSKPSKKWAKSAANLLEQIGEETYKQRILKWFPLVDKPRTQEVEHRPGWASPNRNLLIDDLNADILKGLVWICAQYNDPEITRALTALAFSAYKKVPHRGPRCTKVGNACVWVLGSLPGIDGIGQLALLKLRVKTRNVQNGIERALSAAAEREGIPRDEIEEISVPTYGLQKAGIRQETLADYTAELHITGTKSTELCWTRPDGKPQKSVPQAVRQNHPAELKALRQAAKDIKKMLPAQRDRIDNLYLKQKQWDYIVWQERYLDHPLVGTLARRIIWQFEDRDRQSAGIWWQGQICSQDGTPLEFLGTTTKVSLWHPIDAPIETVLAWRDWLLEHEVQQPFKQAHREIYPLTDAERETRVYSNRFAAHIIRQHQFHALCGVRGWRNKLRLMVDDFYGPPVKLLPEWGLRAEFWVEGIGDTYGVDTSEAGTYLYLTTDQVRFYREGAPGNYAHANGGGYRTGYFGRDRGEPIPLEEIPPLVLSEVMRDVDLFVGVASIGNDPNWLDGGPEVRHRDYWHSYSFGALSETAQTRKQVLEQLLPALKIAAQCELTERFLVVRGDLRTYKIHLGSGNILMAPNDQYLCIVPARGAAAKGQAGKVFLPFEGDQTLSIILSKAFLLAADTKITDPTITRQIQSKR